MKKGSFVAFLFGAGVPFLLFSFIAYTWTGGFRLTGPGGAGEHFMLTGAVSVIIGVFTVFAHYRHEGADEINAIGAEAKEGRALLWTTLLGLGSSWARPIVISLALYGVGSFLLMLSYFGGALLIVVGQAFWIAGRKKVSRVLSNEIVPKEEHDPVERLARATTVISAF